MITNFEAMPRPLRWLTLFSAGFLLIAARAALVGGVIAADGTPVSSSRWWLSGAGAGTSIASALLVASAVLMLVRSRHARRMCVLGWCVASVSVALMESVTGLSLAAILSHLILGALFVVVIGLYLFKNERVAVYFDTENAQGSHPRG
ncbi:hypothetical protein [Anaeromyxobacter oryzisoli]|uniref:hypothetical protein n=1 Tax=Anaeromyxobacter oryzisoli TaxID=2925408 RepID=UPI001F56569B|nr:hypothetical protein [Anaeromyxobacter sp. SG63]